MPMGDVQGVPIGDMCRSANGRCVRVPMGDVQWVKHLEMHAGISDDKGTGFTIW